MQGVSYPLDVEIELQCLQYDKLDAGDVFLFQFVDGPCESIDVEDVVCRLSCEEQADRP